MVSTGNAKLDSLIQEETDNSLTFDEEFDLRMFAYVLNNRAELESKGYKITCHDGFFGYGYLTLSW